MQKTCIVLTLVALAQTPSPVIDVKSKGVAADGVTDNGPVLKALFENVIGTVEFTPGTYETCSSIPISNKARVAMVVGARAKIQVKPNCGSPTPNWPIFRGELATYSNLFSPTASRKASQANSDR